MEAALQALRDLRVDGVELRMVSGTDLGLREGNASYVITVDLDDEDAYRVYDLDEEHNRIRREMFAPISSAERIPRAEGTHSRARPERLARGDRRNRDTTAVAGALTSLSW